jgi:hypothetical protein
MSGSATTGGTAGTRNGGTGGVGNPGAGAGGVLGEGTAGMSGAPVDGEVTRRYTWLECGRIEADSLRGYAVSSLDIDASGTLLVTNDGAATAWRVAEPFDASVALWTHGGEGAYNTDVSEDGTMVVTSGDLRLVFDAVTGEQLPIPQPPPPALVPFDEICILTQYRFSPDGRYVAGKHYDTIVEVFETTGFSLVAELETTGCGQGLKFDDDSINTPEGAFRTSDWSAATPLNPIAETKGLLAECRVYLEPRHGIRTTCCASGSVDECRTTLSGATLIGGRHPRLSNEGHWLIAAGALLHAPSGETRMLDETASEALFAPNGDVIAGRTDGSVVRYCRTE